MKSILLPAFLVITLSALAQNAGIKNDTAQERMDLTPPTVYTYVEQMPEPGYDMAKYLDEHLQYPDIAYKANIQGRVILKFIVNEDGSASDFKVEKSIGGGCDEEAIRALSSMPKWKAGVHNGLPVRVWAMLPVSFTLTHAEQVYTYVEQMPRPGFDLPTYLSRNLNYPDGARNKNITGRVIVKFVVNEDGGISDAKVLRGIGGGCDEEAVRVLMNMPPWKPGKQNGKPVKVYFTQPFSFNIDDSRNNNIKKNSTFPKDYVFRLFYDHLDKHPKAEYDYASYFTEHIQYPKIAQESKIQGDVDVKFVVNKDGSIKDFVVLKSIGYGCDSEAIRVVKSMPDWKPGIFNGKKINAEALVTVPFYLSEEEKLRAESKKVHTYVEQMPFSGYDYYGYITQHLRYPDSAKRKNITGEVYVKFIVTESGAIDSVSVLKGLGGGCDEEALRLVKSLPHWNPGKQNNKPVKVYFNMPVLFQRILTSKEIADFAKARKEAIHRREYDFLKYVEDSLHYPDLAKKNNTEGDVIVKFAVDEDGIISDCKVIESLGFGCDEEALRLVSSMPRWTPGIKDGKDTKTYFTQSVSFSLDDGKSKKKRSKNRDH